ncbi:hypothetical protein NIES4071_103370 (plasmid) [Calothrix sp. NIES-4071]|nr:hypothetical protein NIES4071_103370 [Calothrix sp. NIES-4071]BAZ64718.1 hypothetical protein NIES4105_104510 [Calothrix sp. NIES-4105]
MAIATLVVMCLLYISQAWGRRNILDIANAIIAAVLAGYYFKMAEFVIYLCINLLLFKFEDLRNRNRFR